MIIGVLKEIKTEEYRVAMIPGGVRQLVQKGNEIFIQSRAGLGAGYSDESYREAGAQIAETASEVTERAMLVVKIKEPLESEFHLFRDHQSIFGYLHSETRPALVDMLLRKQITAIAFENVMLPDGSFPLLFPMSIIAGQQAVLQGMQFLWNHKGGIGKSLVSYPGLEPAQVVVLGAGHAGTRAASVAAALGCTVTLFEIDRKRIRYLSLLLPHNIRLLHTEAVSLSEYVCQADMVINATAIPPYSSPHLIDRLMVSRMKKGSVIIDLTANLKGAIETVDHYTTHNDPVWEENGVIHYAVSNIPGTVAHTASQALSLELMPYLIEIADKGILTALQQNSALRAGLTAINGKLTWKDAGIFQNRLWSPPEEVIEVRNEK